MFIMHPTTCHRCSLQGWMKCWTSEATYTTVTSPDVSHIRHGHVYHMAWSTLLSSASSCLVSHLALFLDGLFPCLPLLFAVLLVSGLGGDTGQVRVVDPRHTLGLLDGQASGGEDVQGNPRLAGHADRLRLLKEEKLRFHFESEVL